MAGSGGATGQMLGASIGSYLSAAFNKKDAPATIPYVPVDLQQEQGKAIAGNAAATASIDDLLAQSNAFQQSQASQLMEKALPGYSGFAQNLMGSASKLAKDPYAVPQSVVDQLTQYAAENNIGQGTGAASGFSQSNLLRSLGVNALQYGQSNMTTAMTALSVLTGTAPKTSPMSPLSFMVTPAQQAQNQTYTNTKQQEISQGGENSKTAAQNWNTQSMWDNITAGMTYGGASGDEAWGQVKGMFGGGMMSGISGAAGGSG